MMMMNESWFDSIIKRHSQRCSHDSHAFKLLVFFFLRPLHVPHHSFPISTCAHDHLFAHSNRRHSSQIIELVKQKLRKNDATHAPSVHQEQPVVETTPSPSPLSSSSPTPQSGAPGALTSSAETPVSSPSLTRSDSTSSSSSPVTARALTQSDEQQQQQQPSTPSRVKRLPSEAVDANPFEQLRSSERSYVKYMRLVVTVRMETKGE
jgi:hypothetical protein